MGVKHRTEFHVTLFHDDIVQSEWINPQSKLQAAIKKVFGSNVDVDIILPQPSALCSHCLTEQNELRTEVKPIPAVLGLGWLPGWKGELQVMVYCITLIVLGYLLCNWLRIG